MHACQVEEFIFVIEGDNIVTQRRHGRLENMKCEEAVKKIWKALKMVVLSALHMDLQIELDPQEEKK